MIRPIVPAELAFAADGTPFSPLFNDIYHSSQGGPHQARHVFLAGNDLPRRWESAQRFVILETGFGIGLNFLATWQAWRLSASGRPRCLHYVAVECHPFRSPDLAKLHAAWPEFAELSSMLLAQWPLPLPGLHRLDLGDVQLTLALGDASALLPQLSLAANALYLDGFAPDRNPDLWSEPVIRSLRRLMAPGATLATWTVAGEIRRRLVNADFSVERRPGFGGKREMLVGHVAGTDRLVVPPRRHVAVIGAGIAGASVARALAQRGHRIVVLESGPGPASGASGNRAGVFRPLPSMDDSRLSRVLRAGFLLGRRRYSEFPSIRLGWTGVLHLARDAKHETTQRRIASEQGFPEEYCRYVTTDEAELLARWPVAGGGWWFPQAGWVNPPSACQAMLDGIDCRFEFTVDSLRQCTSGWRIGGNGLVLEVDAVVLANGVETPGLVPELQLPIRAGRGAVSHLPISPAGVPEIVLTRLGYVTPAVDGIHCAGATMTLDSHDSVLRDTDHAENLYRLEMLLPGYAKNVTPESLQGRVAFRPMSPDRLPLVGPASSAEGCWIANGFGARGLVFAPICAELLASQLDGDPLPLERDLVASMAPQRRWPRQSVRASGDL